MANHSGSRKTRTPRRKSAKNSLAPIQPHDSGYKLLFSHPAMVVDLLNGFVAEDWVRELDFSTLEKQSGSYRRCCRWCCTTVDRRGRRRPRWGR